MWAVAWVGRSTSQLYCGDVGGEAAVCLHLEQLPCLFCTKRRRKGGGWEGAVSWQELRVSKWLDVSFSNVYNHSFNAFLNKYGRLRLKQSQSSQGFAVLNSHITTV